jgi:hypothetical protein
MAMPQTNHVSPFSVLPSSVASAARSASLPKVSIFMTSMAGLKFYVRNGTAHLRWSWKISIAP